MCESLLPQHANTKNEWYHKGQLLYLRRLSDNNTDAKLWERFVDKEWKLTASTFLAQSPLALPCIAPPKNYFDTEAKVLGTA